MIGPNKEEASISEELLDIEIDKEEASTSEEFLLTEIKQKKESIILNKQTKRREYYTR